MDHVLIGSLYRPLITTFWELCSKEKKKLYLLGDFNLDLLRHDSQNNYSFKHNNTIISNPKQICNNYFLYVGKSLSSKIPASQLYPFPLLQTNDRDGNIIINKFKKKLPWTRWSRCNTIYSVQACMECKLLVLLISKYVAIVRISVYTSDMVIGTGIVYWISVYWISVYTSDMVIGTGIYIVHETGRRQWSGIA